MPDLTCVLPDPGVLELTDITGIAEEPHLVMTLAVTQKAAACPQCGQLATRIHSRYMRRVADLPWTGLPVRLLLQAHRWFCDQSACPRRIFAERLPHVVRARGRRTLRLAAAQQRIALTLGGAAGVDLVLSLARQAPRSTPTTSPHGGIDDWAKRTAHHYGTIVVDLDTGPPIARLDDRSADQVAAWLQAHPEVRVVRRDRGQVYGEGATRGAPQAVQVADRWHLVKNLGEARIQVLQKHQRAMTEARKPPAQADLSESASHVEATLAPSPKEPAGMSTRGVIPADQRRKARYAAIRELHERGGSQKAIAQHLERERKTVRTYVRMGAELTPRRHTPRASRLERFKPYIVERWNAGCHNAMQILRELQEEGFTGQRAIVRAVLTQLRQAQGLPPRTRSTPQGVCASDPTRRAPGLRNLTWLVLKRDVKLSDDEKHQVAQRATVHADLATAVALAQKCAELIRQRTVEQLDAWLTQAELRGLRALRSFAAGLKQDLAAVRAAFSLPWSQGPVEGNSNRLKVLKRHMYGRAQLDLLEQRLLAR